MWPISHKYLAKQRIMEKTLVSVPTSEASRMYVHTGFVLVWQFSNIHIKYFHLIRIRWNHLMCFFEKHKTHKLYQLYCEELPHVEETWQRNVTKKHEGLLLVWNSALCIFKSYFIPEVSYFWFRRAQWSYLWVFIISFPFPCIGGGL